MKDPIERQDAIDTVFKFLGKREIARTIQTALWILPSAQQDCTECEECDSETKSCPKYCDVIKQTVEEVKQERTGRWIPDNNNMYEMRFICSECKESQVVPTIGFIKYKPLWDYCPNCGARMEGEG